MVNQPLNLMEANESLQNIDDNGSQKEMELVSVNDDAASQNYMQQ